MFKLILTALLLTFLVAGRAYSDEQCSNEFAIYWDSAEYTESQGDFLISSFQSSSYREMAELAVDVISLLHKKDLDSTKLIVCLLIHLESHNHEIPEQLFKGLAEELKKKLKKT